MLLLPNGNKCSDLAVFPKNWKKLTRITGHWHISYRFYQQGQKPKQVFIKGMNSYHDLADRKAITKALLENEMFMLLNDGYNPITKTRNPEELNSEISPDTFLTKALKYALEKTLCSHTTRLDISSVIKYFTKSAYQLSFSQLKIGEVRRKHVKMILDNIGNVKKIWTDNNFNHYRKYLSKLFSDLIELEAMEFNPITYIKKRKTFSKVRETISHEERLKIDRHLKKRGQFRLRLYMRIFFHSGSRTSELLNIKSKDVFIDGNYFICTIQKGTQTRQVKKTIKDISVRYWKLALKGSEPEDYVFGLGLKPGIKCQRDYVTYLWEKFVKKQLGIKADFYSLKHSHTTEVVDLLDSQTAATINGHTDTNMVAKVYDIRRGQREHNKIKNLKNAFI